MLRKIIQKVLVLVLCRSEVGPDSITLCCIRYYSYQINAVLLIEFTHINHEINQVMFS